MSCRRTRDTARRCAGSSGPGRGSSWRAGATTTFCTFGMCQWLPLSRLLAATSGYTGSRTTWPL
uniref:Cell division cycle protein 20 n=1 Tax=Arundo donax TaxID=35708 RepID=A0A0A9EL49_ARUDO